MSNDNPYGWYYKVTRLVFRIILEGIAVLAVFLLLLNYMYKKGYEEYKENPLKPNVFRKLIVVNRGDQIDDHFLYELEYVIKTTIKYESDGSIGEYWQTPYETFILEKGDCEDRAILLAHAIFLVTREMPALVVWKNTLQDTLHMAVRYRGKDYLLEGSNWKAIGWLTLTDALLVATESIPRRRTSWELIKRRLRTTALPH